MSKVVMSITTGLALWFLILSGIEWAFNVEWLSKGKYYILIGLFVVFAIVNVVIISLRGGKKCKQV